MESVDEYIALLDEPKKEWVTSMVNFMREVFPDVEETLSNKMPTYKGDGYYIAFAAQKNYFTFHTDERMVLSLIKELIPSASMGKSCAKTKYNNEGAEKMVKNTTTCATVTYWECILFKMWCYNNCGIWYS